MKDSRKDTYTIIGYFIALAILAILSSTMFIDMSTKGYVNENVINSIDKDYKEAWFNMLTLLFGAFFGANLVVVAFDRRKRLQGILITISSIFVVLEFPYIISLRIITFIIGLVATVAICYAYNNREKKKGYRRYSLAIKTVSFLAMNVMISSFINYMLGDPNMTDTIKYLLYTIGFVIVFKKFVDYEVVKASVFVVGLKETGKTVFMCGCYECADHHNKTVGLPSEDLIRSLIRLRMGVWPLATGDIPQYFNFGYEYGTLFVKEVSVNTIDVSGERINIMINGIINFIEKKIENPDLEPSSPSDVGEVAGAEIYGADTLIFLIDARRIGSMTAENSYVEQYLKILEKLKISNKPYYIFVTKSDIFYDNNWGLTEEGYELLKIRVMSELEARDPFREFRRGAEDIIPVCFFETEDKKPVVIENKFSNIGFEKALEVIAR